MDLCSKFINHLCTYQNCPLIIIKMTYNTLNLFDFKLFKSKRLDYQRYSIFFSWPECDDFSSCIVCSPFLFARICIKQSSKILGTMFRVIAWRFLKWGFRKKYEINNKCIWTKKNTDLGKGLDTHCSRYFWIKK